MIDHVSIVVRDLAKSRAFYVAALVPLGYGVVMEPGPDAVGFGTGRKPTFFITAGTPSYWRSGHAAAASPIHLAFAAPSRAAIAQFHAAAIAAGGTDFGAPGLRPKYHPGYYGAFVLDPDGNDVEAVSHTPE